MVMSIMKDGSKGLVAPHGRSVISHSLVDVDRHRSTVAVLAVACPLLLVSPHAVVDTAAGKEAVITVRAVMIMLVDEKKNAAKAATVTSSHLDRRAPVLTDPVSRETTTALGVVGITARTRLAGQMGVRTAAEDKPAGPSP